MKDLWKSAKIVQGDVFLVAIDKIPSNSKPITHVRGIVLAEGAHTGHAHVADCGDLYEYNGTLLLDVPIGTTVRHEEHNPVVVPSGKYRIGRILEYDPFAEEARSVQD